MECFKKFAAIVYFTLLFVILFEQPTQAYIDPGTGSLVIQFIIGGIVGISIAIKVFWSKIVRIFYRKDKD